VVGRDDGTIEAITFDEEMPKLLFSVNVNECVMTVAAGHITDPGRDEIIATTFSGKVIGFVARPEGDDGAASPAGQSEAKVTSVRSELEDLHKQLAEKKETLNSFSGPGIIPVQAAFKVHEKMMLGEDAMWNLNLEIEFPIEFVTLQSDIELEIMQEPNDTAVLSHCDPSPEEGNLMVATYSCVETSSRLNLKIRMIEGQMGMLRAYIIPSSSGGQGKVCQCSSFKIKPLSLHRRAHSADLSNHILSEIRVEGTFSVAEVHSWISNCLPEMPDRYTNTLETLNSLPIVCEITALVICGQASNILDAAGLQMTTMKSYSSQHLWKQYSVVSTAKMKLSSSAIPFLHCLY